MSFLHTKFLLMNALLGLGAALLKPPQLGKEIPYLPQTTLVKRIDNTQASFYACDDANWGGRCQWFQAPVGECLNMPILLQDQISSFGPDLGYICSAYIDTNCQPDGDSVKIYQYPGVADLNKEALQWNDRISSVKCVLTNPQDSSGIYKYDRVDVLVHLLYGNG
ncbi:hypothetical protein SLS56_003055 [Neofusicoccum ribis]|uniref:Small secreted protein n=1 Tax=Neofusicoccum ribis TaxID=45134 RepID=A0ABR3T0Y7_9PEZI